MKPVWRWPELVFEVLPIVLLSFGLTLAGDLWSATKLSRAHTVSLWICLVGIYAALMVFKAARGWNLGLLGIFSLLVGATLTSWLPGGAPSRWAALCVVGGLTTACGVVGLSLRTGFKWPVRLFWAASLPYLIGWLILVVWQVGARWLGMWAGLGVLLFGGLTIGWFAAWRTLPPVPSGTASAIDLYLLTASMGLAVMVLLANPL